MNKPWRVFILSAEPFDALAILRKLYIYRPDSSSARVHPCSLLVFLRAAMTLTEVEQALDRAGVGPELHRTIARDGLGVVHIQVDHDDAWYPACEAPALSGVALACTYQYHRGERPDLDPEDQAREALERISVYVPGLVARVVYGACASIQHELREPEDDGSCGSCSYFQHSLDPMVPGRCVLDDDLAIWDADKRHVECGLAFDDEEMD